MPQLNPEFFTPQVFWLVVSFLVLYFVMWRVALPKVADLLQERQERIDDDLEKAEALKKEAEAVLEAYEAAMAEARSNAQAQIREAAERMAEEATKRHAELSERLARQTAEAEARIASERDAALAGVKDVAADVARAAAARLIEAEVPASEADKAVGAVLEERR